MSRRKILTELLEERTQAEVFSRADVARALNLVLEHITISRQKIDEAAEKYSEIGAYLVEALHWDSNDIRVLPQGSAATQTLIKSPRRKDFDIDAVCEVSSRRIDVNNPIGFFNTIGKALQQRYVEDLSRKNRCWTINRPKSGFYIEFTPSVPWATTDPSNTHILSGRYTQYGHIDQYQATAQSVVDMKTRSWKPSNPEGFARWVSDTAHKTLLQDSRQEVLFAKADVSPIATQSVGIDDSLRAAIRLFKRHRDMAVYGKHIEAEDQPISVILVTLVTRAYDRLHADQQRYDHPLNLLLDLAEQLPDGVSRRDDGWWVENPTVRGENFAEKWNRPQSRREKAFRQWHALLYGDLIRILKAPDRETVLRLTREVFGVSGPGTPDTGRPPGRGHVVRPENPHDGLG